MMNWYSQLAQLILSFYREDRSQLQQLQSLRACKLSRRWGVLRIRCADRATAQALINAIDLLRTPIAELRLAQQIKIMVNGNLVTTFPVKPSKLKV
jgi:hypothetical protein